MILHIHLSFNQCKQWQVNDSIDTFELLMILHPSCRCSTASLIVIGLNRIIYQFWNAAAGQLQTLTKQQQLYYFWQMSLFCRTERTADDQIRGSLAKSVPFAAWLKKIHAQNIWDSRVNWIHVKITHSNKVHLLHLMQ